MLGEDQSVQMPSLRHVVEKFDPADCECQGLQVCLYTHAGSHNAIDDLAENKRAAVSEFGVISHLEASTAGCCPHDKLTSCGSPAAAAHQSYVSV